MSEEKAKETALEDWGIFDNESQALSSKKDNQTQNEEGDETGQKKGKGKKIKLKPKEREDEENIEINNEEEEPKKDKKKNTNNTNVYKTIYQHMKNIQPDASKSIKRKTYELLKKYVEDNDLDDDCYDLLIKGDDKSDIPGLCELVSKKTRTGSFKGSTHEFIKIIHYWFREIEEEKSKKMVENFSLNEEYIKAMKLGDHYSRLCN